RYCRAPRQAQQDRATRDSIVERLVRRVVRRGDRTLDVLLLSGGGQNGAFGAGFLRGWRARSDERMPTFDLVSGISTGALQSPYALLGTPAAIDTLTALGFKVKESPHLRARRGHFAGTDAQRAAALNAMFKDPDVHGVLAITGGSGANRILPLLDYAQLRRTPKFVGGFSDITALLHAVHSQTGLVTYHCPAAVSEWNEFSWRHFRGVAMEGTPVLMRNESDKGSLPAPREDRTLTIRPGVARGPLLGGNLAVLSSLCGSGYLRSFDGAILFLEEINEFIYRVDRMLSTLKLAGVLDRLSGVMLGAFTNCTPGDGFWTLTLDEVFEDYFGGLGIPVYRGA
ncbi:MAG: hypothetical protein EBR46_10170, partial [Betaproteobacteria bacterium]|nr:hypothetical protein [Betaproteobacteria bacterium]